MAENIQIELDHLEASVAEYVFDDVLRSDGMGRLRALDNVERIQAAKSVLRKVRSGQKQRLAHIETTPSSQRDLLTPVQAENSKLLGENRALKSELKELVVLCSEVEKSLMSGNVEYARNLLDLRDKGLLVEELGGV